MKHIVTVIGARPQFIKAATISRVLQKVQRIKETIVHTGQHYDDNMSDVFFRELDIPEPDYNLGIGGSLHGEMTGHQLIALESLLLNEKPDVVLVYGDTNSTLAGALAAVKLHIPIAHVEAGLRSYNRQMPEEINRILTDHISEWLFTPTPLAVRNLEYEGICGDNIHPVGDVMYDAMLYYRKKAERQSSILSELGFGKRDYILATVHRAENTDNKERITNIISALEETEVPVLLPLHPRTQKQINKFKIQIPASVKILNPLGYLDMVMLEKNAHLIMTDSGGVQKEAYFNHVPCLTLREETEWEELVDNRQNKLVGTDIDRIKSGLSLDWYDDGAEVKQFFGDGNAAKKIAAILAT